MIYIKKFKFVDIETPHRDIYKNVNPILYNATFFVILLQHG